MKYNILLQIQHYVGDGTGGMSNSVIDKYFSDPISDNIDVFSTFTFVVCGFLSLLGIYKIYIKMMNGDQDVQKTVFRWASAIIAILLLASVLEYIAQNQTPLKADSNIQNIAK